MAPSALLLFCLQLQIGPGFAVSRRLTPLPLLPNGLPAALGKVQSKLRKANDHDMAAVSRDSELELEDGGAKGFRYTIQVLELETGASFNASAPEGCQTLQRRPFLMDCLFGVDDDFLIEQSLLPGREVDAGAFSEIDRTTTLGGMAAMFQSMVPPWHAHCPACARNCSTALAGQTVETTPLFAECGAGARASYLVSQAVLPKEALKLASSVKVIEKTLIAHSSGRHIGLFQVAYTIGNLRALRRRVKRESATAVFAP